MRVSYTYREKYVYSNPGFILWWFRDNWNESAVVYVVHDSVSRRTTKMSTRDLTGTLVSPGSKHY